MVVHKFTGKNSEICIVNVGDKRPRFRVAVRKPGARGRHKFYVSAWGKKTYETSKRWNAYMLAYRLNNELNA